MKIIAESITFVLAGKWNRHILTPAWVSEHLFSAQEIQIELALNDMDSLLRFSHGDIRLVAMPDKIMITALSNTPEILDKIEAIAKMLASQLPHTPLSAFGININFQSDSPPTDLVETFNFCDNSKYSDADIEIISSAILRKIKVLDNVCNLTLKNEEGVTSFLFNFHKDVKGTSEVLSIPTGIMNTLIYKAIELMQTIYSLSLDTSTE